MIKDCIILIITIILLTCSCTQERLPCLTPKIASLNIECVHHNTDSTTIDTALPAAVFGAMTATGIKAEIFPLQSNFTISLSSVSDTCRWIFTTDSLKYNVDTLSFYYRRSLQFLSNACGFAYFYSLDSVHTSHFNIDSVLITNTSVTNNANIKQLKIYIRN